MLNMVNSGSRVSCYTKIFFSGLYLIVLFGAVLPFLFSQKSTFLVVVGALLVSVTVFQFGRWIIQWFDESLDDNKKKDENEVQ